MELFGRQDHTLGRVLSDRPALPAADDGARLDGGRVLLVEDNRVNQDIACEWLGSMGLTVTTAANGQEALQTLDKASFDAVLMDVQMPVMDGFEATRRIREDLKMADLPVIAMTAHALAGDREKCLKAGMDDYITKPIDPQVLLDTLSKWVVPVKEAPPGPEAEPTGEMPELPGIDVRTGLYRTNNNKTLFFKVLRSFVEDYHDARDRLVDDLAQGRKEEASRLAHSLKGVGGNIGALDLHDRAAAVEAAIEADTLDMNSDIWADFAQALDRVINGLGKADLLPEPQQPSASVSEGAADRSLWPKHLDRLVKLIDEDLTGARALIDEMRPGLKNTDEADLFQEMVDQIDDFDLDRAARTLARLTEVFQRTRDSICRTRIGNKDCLLWTTTSRTLK